MYTVCTGRLSRAVAAPYLLGISRAFIWVAFAAWLLTAVGLTFRVVQVGSSLVRRRA